LKKNKKAFGPHLNRIFSIWFNSFFDVTPEVGMVARDNFNFAFPKAKQGEVFKIAQKNYLNYVKEQILHTEESMNEDSGMDMVKQQKEELYDRIVSGVLQSVSDHFEFI
jgi:hypothetical protein